MELYLEDLITRVVGELSEKELSDTPIITDSKLRVYLYGVNNLKPMVKDPFHIEWVTSLGEITYECSGESLKYVGGVYYEFCSSPEYYLITIQFKVDGNQSSGGKGILSIVKKNEIPSTVNEEPEYWRKQIILIEMMVSHFERLFGNYSKYEEIIRDGWEVIEKESNVYECIMEYFHKINRNKP